MPALIRCALAIALTLSVSTFYSEYAHANWLTRLARGGAEVGEAGQRGSQARHRRASTHAADYVARLPKPAKGAALAAHATPEGHWKFVSREGEVFTAGNADELARVGTVLAPDAAAGDKLALYLTEDTVFAERALLKDLPPDAELYIVAGKDGFRLRRTGERSGRRPRRRGPAQHHRGSQRPEAVRRDGVPARPAR